MKLKNAYPLLEKTDAGNCIASKLKLSLRSVKSIYRDHLKKHSVTMSQYSLLITTGKRVSVLQSESGKILILERSTITRDLKRLVEKGYIVKEGAVSRPIISITDKGVSYVERIIPDWYKATQEAIKQLGTDGENALNLVLKKSNQ